MVTVKMILGGEYRKRRKGLGFENRQHSHYYDRDLTKRFKRQETVQNQLVRGLAITIGAILLTVLTTRSNRQSAARSAQGETCAINLERLQIFNLTETFKYSQRTVNAQARPKNDGILPDDILDGDNEAEIRYLDMLPPSTLVNTSTQSQDLYDLACMKEPAQLSLRQWQDEGEQVDASHLLFGVASTAERLLEARDHLAFWLGKSKARLTIAVPESPLLPWLKYELERRDVLVNIVVSNEPTFLGSYFRLLLWLKETRTDKTKWVTFIDDDTFFFSLKRFVTMLRKYDEQDEHYIGAVSEDGWQMMRSGEFAFGGAGITLSVPLLDRLIPYYDVCKKYAQVDPTAPEMGGDLRLARCITRNTPVKLSRESDLHQVDLRGDVRGMIQGPRVPITWHHYRSRSWGSFNVLAHARSVPFCSGNDCLFQRWKFYDSAGQVSMLHLGHSYVRFASGVDPDTSTYEATWDRKLLSTYDHSLEPLRRAYIEGEEIFTYTLEHGQWLQDGSYAQTYIRRADPKADDAVDEVVELLWRA